MTLTFRASKLPHSLAETALLFLCKLELHTAMYTIKQYSSHLKLYGTNYLLMTVIFLHFHFLNGTPIYLQISYSFEELH